MTRVTEEAVQAAARACHESDFAWSSQGIHEEYWRKMALAALEAALPHLEGAALVATREHLAKVLDPDAFDENKPRSKHPAAVIQWAARQHMAYEGADRLLTAGVFREGATPAIDREALQRLIEGAEHYDTCDLSLSPLTNQFGCSCLLADLRALIGGAQ